jgi:hypothetical protein
MARAHRPSHEALLTLHRYFVWAGEFHVQLMNIFMRGRDQRSLPVLRRVMKHITNGTWPRRSKLDQLRTFLYLSYWYAALYVVVDGWQELGLADARVDPLLEPAKLELLRRHRNAVFHYQPDYVPEKMLALMREGATIAEWARTLHFEIGDAILERVKATDRH